MGMGAARFLAPRGLQSRDTPVAECTAPGARVLILPSPKGAAALGK